MKWETAWKKSVKLREEYERLWSEVSRREKKGWYNKKVSDKIDGRVKKG